MKIEYVGHACVLVDTGDLKIVTDPWFAGPAYCGQWHIFPKPVNVDKLMQSDVVLLSHGHEDHLHEASLQSLPKSARVLYPYSWYGGVKPFLKEIGFANVTEAFGGKRYQLAPDVSVTYVVNSMDSIVVIESRGRVFVNVNDALHSYPPKIVELFVNYIRNRWERVDTVFCGFGGASYFPNTIHCAGKNDKDVAETREQLFAQNFCSIVHALQPRVAVPFAVDFALLHQEQRWINDVRFPRTRLPEYYEMLYGPEENGPRIQVMYSGDVLMDDQFEQRSPYWRSVRESRLHTLVDEQYKMEIDELDRIEILSDEEAGTVEAELAANIQLRSKLLDRKLLPQLNFAMYVSDFAAPRPYLNVRWDSKQFKVERCAERAPDAILEIRTSSKILRHSVASDWGGDAITIGYGCEIEVFDPATIAKQLDVFCVRLLTRHPQASRHWQVEPIRIAAHMLTSPLTRKWVFKSVIGKQKVYRDKATDEFTRELLFRTKCEACNACNLPLLDQNFAQTM